MQNPLVNAPNGAICCKLWPQTMSGVGPNFGVDNWFKSGGQIGSNLRPWALPNCVRGLQNQGFRILGNRASSAPNLAPFGGPNLAPFGGHGEQNGINLEAPEQCQKQGCCQEPPRGIRKPTVEGGDPTGGQTGPRGGGQQEEGKDLRRLVDPKGSADKFDMRSCCTLLRPPCILQ